MKSINTVVIALRAFVMVLAFGFVVETLCTLFEGQELDGLNLLRCVLFSMLLACGAFFGSLVSVTHVKKLIDESQDDCDS